MKHVAIGFLISIVGYVIVAFIGYFLILKLSSNGHDRKLEASMTSVFVLGPLGAILFFIAGYIWARKSS